MPCALPGEGDEGPPHSGEVLALRTASEVRVRAARLLSAGLRGELPHFRVDLEKLPEVAARTARITRRRYPTLEVPPHSRFTHFDAGGVPRLAGLTRDLAALGDACEQARALADIAVTSVLLDAGAGPNWEYREEATGQSFGRSEGLAVASLAWAREGGLSSEGKPFAVDAAGLLAVTESALAHAFQVTAANPLVGLEGRVHLLQALGAALQARPDVFTRAARIGGMVDTLAEQARGEGQSLPAESILAMVLDGLGSIWPGRLSIDGLALGDVWPHPAAGGSGKTMGLLPLHKLSQWLSYSLLHPLAVAGVTVREVGGLTGLAEYRNGGLFVDGGVLVLRDPRAAAVAHPVGSELIVEWRGLTVALLDRVAPLVREALGVSESALPLAAVLEGGTWAAGREVASELREGGSPPLRVVSDGTVF